VDTKMFLEQRI